MRDGYGNRKGPRPSAGAAFPSLGSHFKHGRGAKPCMESNPILAGGSCKGGRVGSRDRQAAPVPGALVPRPPTLGFPPWQFRGAVRRQRLDSLAQHWFPTSNLARLKQRPGRSPTPLRLSTVRAVTAGWPRRPNRRTARAGHPGSGLHSCCISRRLHA